jgi:hypothetical protein
VTLTPLVYVALGIGLGGVLILVVTLTYWLATRCKASDGTEVMPDSRDG